MLAGRASRPDAGVDAVLARVSPAVRRLVSELRVHLEDDGARVKTTGTAGGDVRHHDTRVNLSDMRFRREAVDLGPRLGAGSVRDDDLVWNKGEHDSRDVARVRVRAGEPLPAKVLDWIAGAKAFTRSRFG